MKKAVLFISCLLPVAAMADDMAEMAYKAKQLELISPEEAVEIATQEKPGLVDDVDLENRQFFGGWDYEIEIDGRDGKEWDVYINAETGEVRKSRRDWF